MSASRRAWLIVGSIVAAASVGFGTFQVVSLLASTTEEVTTTFGGTVHLVVRNDVGRIRLNPSPNSSLTVHRTVTSGLFKPSYTERKQGETLMLDAECRGRFSSHCEVHLDISVPAGVDVDAASRGGSVRADGLDAGLRLRSSGGGITVVGGGSTLDVDSSGGSVNVESGRASDVKARSSGGSVRVRSAIVPGTVDARSSGGSVTVELPDGPTSYRVDATSSGGSARTQVRTDPTSDRRITARSSGGSVTVRYLSPT